MIPRSRIRIWYPQSCRFICSPSQLCSNKSATSACLCSSKPSLRSSKRRAFRFPSLRPPTNAECLSPRRIPRRPCTSRHSPWFSAPPVPCPQPLHSTLFAIEQLASFDHRLRLDEICQRRFPCLAVSPCSLDRALDAWFCCPEELSQFTASNGKDAEEPGAKKHPESGPVDGPPSA